MSWILNRIKDILPNRPFGKTAKDNRVARLIDLNQTIDSTNTILSEISNEIDSLNSGYIKGCGYKTNFKPGSVGPKVSFRKESGTAPTTYKDIIIPGELEITRGNGGGGIYNIAVEPNYSGANDSPQFTYWNSQYITPENTSWAPLWDIQNRAYDTWRSASETPEGDVAPPQYVGMPVIMQWNNGADAPRYWLVLFTEWGVGQYDEYGFAYDRYEIFPEVTFTRPDYREDIVDVLSPGVHIARESNQGQIFNSVNEPDAETGVSPRNTKWNSIYTDSRLGYSGFSDLSNLESRVYTDFALALDESVGSNVLNTDLIMHDLTTDLYYKVTFSDWTSNGNGGGFTYTRQVIPQSCGIKFADGTVMNTAVSSGEACCPVLDANTNLIIDDNSANTISVANGASQLIDSFSGMLIVNDHFDGRVETWICGGGDGVLLGFTNVSAGSCNSTLTISANGYEWTNVDNMTGPFTFTVIKTRNNG